jgi:hypothetical protein
LTWPVSRPRGGVIRLALAGAFVVWAAVFVARSSVAGIDGHRYFCLFDDAMVSMRYAFNLAHGAGLVWNAGERVEGYTNFLWTLVMSVATGTLDRSHAVLAVQLLGIPILLALAFASRRLAEQAAPGERGTPTLAFALALFHYPLAYWTLLGMETGLVALLWVLMILEAFRGEGEARPSWRLVLLLGLAYLTRPDTVIVGALVLAYRALTASRRSAAVEAAGLAVVVAGHTAFRLAYYGELVPNTYRLKIEGIPAAVRVVNGLHYAWPWAALAALLALLAAGGLGRAPAGRRRLLFASALVLLAYQVWIGGDLNDHWRFLCSAALFLVPLAPSGAAAWVARAARGVSPRTASAAVVALVAAAVVLPGVPFAGEQVFLKDAKSVAQNRDSVNVALTLDDLLRPDATIAVFWAGAIPYYAPFHAFDLLGKSDRYVAGLPPDLSGTLTWSRMRYVPGHNRYDLRRTVEKLRPTFLEHEVWGRDDLSATILETYVPVYTSHGRLLLRRDSPSVRWDRLKALH